MEEDGRLPRQARTILCRMRDAFMCLWLRAHRMPMRGFIQCLELPDMDIVGIATSYGIPAEHVDSLSDLTRTAKTHSHPMGHA